MNNYQGINNNNNNKRFLQKWHKKFYLIPHKVQAKLHLWKIQPFKQPGTFKKTWKKKATTINFQFKESNSNRKKSLQYDPQLYINSNLPDMEFFKAKIRRISRLNKYNRCKLQ